MEARTQHLDDAVLFLNWKSKFYNGHMERKNKQKWKQFLRSQRVFFPLFFFRREQEWKERDEKVI